MLSSSLEEKHNSNEGRLGESGIEVENVKDGEHSDDREKFTGKPFGLALVNENSPYRLKRPSSRSKMVMTHEMAKAKTLAGNLYLVRTGLKRLSSQHAMLMEHVLF